MNKTYTVSLTLLLICILGWLLYSYHGTKTIKPERGISCHQQLSLFGKWISIGCYQPENNCFDLEATKKYQPDGIVFYLKKDECK